MAWFQNLTVVLKFLPLLFVAVAGWFFVSAANFGPFNALGGSLELPEGREFVLDRVAVPEILGPNLVNPVRRMLGDLDGQALAGLLVGGILKADLRPGGGGHRELCAGASLVME